MASLTDGLKDIFLASVGAVSIGGEKAKEVLDSLVERGQISVEEGKKINEELKHKAHEAGGQFRDETIRAYVKTLSPEEREAFAQRVSSIASEIPQKDDEEVIDVEAEVIEPEPLAEDAEDEASAAPEAGI